MIRLPKPISTSTINNAFELEAFLAGSRCTFTIGGFGARAPAFPNLLNYPGVVDFRSSDASFAATFDHAVCDGLGAFNVLRSNLLGERPPRISEIVPTSEPSTRSTRRLAARATADTARLSPTAANTGRVATVIFRLHQSKRRGLTVTEEVVRACHLLAIERASSRRTCSSILVSATAIPWSPTRPANNLSAGFLSVMTPSDLGCADEVLKEQFAIARATRFALLRRTARFGQIPRTLWPLLTRAKRSLPGAGGGTAIVSNLGRIEDAVLADAAPAWYVIAPVRNPRCVSVALVGVQGAVVGTVSADAAASADVRDLALNIWDRTNLQAEQVSL